MLEKSFGLLFFLKQSKNGKKERYVYLRITVNGRSRELSTKRIWFADRWSQSGKATGNKEDAKSLNAYLESISSRVYHVKKELIDGDRIITADLIKNVLIGEDGKDRMLLEFFNGYNEQVSKLVGSEYKIRTYQRLTTTYNHVYGFIRDRYQRNDVELREVDFNFIEALSYWLRVTKKCNHNSSMKYLSIFKKIILNARKKGLISKNPFADFKITTKEVKIEVLSDMELQRLKEKDFREIPRLELVRDIFVFSCYTGLAYVDVYNLRRNQIIMGIDGEDWIITQREKTDTPTRLPLLPVPLAILKKHESHPRCIRDGFALPVLTNQKMNSYLKEIADVCRISKRLTFHIARHTFATTVCLCNDVPIETVSKMLGHKSLKQTQHYAKVVDTKIAKDMRILKTALQQ